MVNDSSERIEITDNSSAIAKFTEAAQDRESSSRRRSGLGRVVLISLLVMLNMPLFFTGFTGMDQYGFFTLDSLADHPVPIVLSFTMSSVLAVTGYILYRFLWARRAWFMGESWGPFTRGAVLSAAPVALSFAPVIILTSQGGKPTQIAIAGLMAGSLCITHALRDPETVLDSALARYWFAAVIASVLVFLALSVAGMLVLFFVEQLPASDNLLWKWEYTWAQLGYPPEEFQQRQREALVAFTLTGSGFMIVILGGSMLGAVLRWTRLPEYAGVRRTQWQKSNEVPAWVARVLLELDSIGPANPLEAEFVVVCNGYEVDITKVQYEVLLGRKDSMLRDADLLVDRASEEVFARGDSAWSRIEFRVRSSTDAFRSGPFVLLCTYARNPGRRFTNGELRALIERELTSRLSLNIGDLIRQLQRREPSIPVLRDAEGSYLPDTLNVCLLDHKGPRDRESPKTQSVIRNQLK